MGNTLSEGKIVNGSASFIPADLYEKIIEHMPIPCVDLVLLHQGKVLLTLRTQEPEKGKWWVQGGRIFKNESLQEALQRLARREIGSEVKILKQIGVYDYFSKVSVFPEVKSGTHCVVVCFLVEPQEKNFSLRMDKTHSEGKWIDCVFEDLEPYVKKVIRDSGVFKR